MPAEGRERLILMLASAMLAVTQLACFSVMIGLIWLTAKMLWGYKPHKQLAPIVFIDTTKAQPGAVWMRCEDSGTSPKLDSRNAHWAISDEKNHIQAIQFEACP